MKRICSRFNSCLRPSDKRLRPFFVWTLGAALTWSLAGCSALPRPVNVDFDTPPPARVAAQPKPAPANGSLFNTASFRPGFEDPRARSVGDAITINIVEKVTASQESKSTANRTSTGATSASALPFLGAADLLNLKAATSSANDFSGKGATASTNTFYGTITATVIDVLPNGHLVVSGDKQIGVNQNVDVMRFTGTVDPRLIQPGNLVNSTQVANARIESRGRGAQSEAQTVGWLTRFFFSVWPF